MTEDEAARRALINAGISVPELRRVRIPPLFEAISLSWIQYAPFLAEFMLRFHFFETPGIAGVGLNCTRGSLNFYFNPDFVYGALSAAELEGLIIHEIEHLVRLHRERMLEDPMLFYAAADLLINEDLRAMKINGAAVSLPEGALYLSGLPDYRGEPVTEPLYRYLAALGPRLEEEAACDGAGGDKHGAGKTLLDRIKGAGAGMDDHRILNTCDELSAQALGKIIESAVLRGWGSMGGMGTLALQGLLRPAPLDWRRLLRRVLSPVHDYGPHVEYSWARRNRKNLPLPGKKKLANKLIVAVDTSGSISEAALQVFFAELEKIVRDFSQLVLIQWDTRVSAVEAVYKKGCWKGLEIKGRGGTDVQCVFDWVVAQGYEKYPLLIFTDGVFDQNFDSHGIFFLIPPGFFTSRSAGRSPGLEPAH
jgi:predicted metal-dependent peptidase